MVKTKGETNSDYDDEIDLIQLIRDVWDKKWIIGAACSATGLMALIVCLFLPDIYRSEVVLAPAAEESAAMSSLARQFGGVAGLAGINLGGMMSKDVNKTTLTLEIMKSRAFLGEFARRHNLVVPLIAAKGWNEESNEWIIDQEIYDSNKEEWLINLGKPPSDNKIRHHFMENVLSIEQDAKTGIIKVTAHLKFPEETERWLRLLIDDINQHMRVRDIEKSEKNIAYLNKQLNNTPIADMRQIFYQLIEDQTKSMMLAEVQQEYAFMVIDPPAVPESNFAPRTKLVVVIVVFLTATILLAVIFFRLALIGGRKPAEC